MLNEAEWLRITQSFPTKLENVEGLPVIVPPKCIQFLESTDKFPRVNNPPAVNESPETSPVIRMKKMLKEKAVKMRGPRPSETDFPPDDRVLDGVATMERRLQSLTSHLEEKNRKIQEQDLEIGKLRRKLATTEITSALMERRGKGGDPEEISLENGKEYQLITKRLAKVEAEMEVFRNQSASSAKEGVHYEEGDLEMKGEVKRSKVWKPRTNLASTYRIAASNSAAVSSSIDNGKLIDLNYFEEKISNLEKIVNSLKQFMFQVITKGRRK